MVVNQETDIAKVCLDVELKSQPLEIVERFWYYGDTIVADSVVTRIRNSWSKFKDFVPQLAIRDLLLKAKGRLHSACLDSIISMEVRLGQLKRKILRYQRGMNQGGWILANELATKIE